MFLIIFFLGPDTQTWKVGRRGPKAEEVSRRRNNGNNYSADRVGQNSRGIQEDSSGTSGSNQTMGEYHRSNAEER